MTYLVRQMGHIVIGSPDPVAAAEDLAEISGLRITERTADAIHLSGNTRHHEVTYVKGDGKVVAVGLEAMSPDAIDEVHRRVKSDGLRILDDRPLSPYYEKTIRFVAPGGTILEVHSPIRRDQPLTYAAHGPRQRRIEHVNSFAPDIAVFGAFCEEVLGMKLSDKTGDDRFRWYRAGDGFHHTLAMGTGPSSLHHYAFDLHSFQDLALIADNLTRKGRTLAWGPGRHGAGGNVFSYYVDPHGCLVENSVEMDRIDSDATYEARIWDISEGLAGRWINLWGTPPPPAFLIPGIPFAV